ncbi:MAG: peptide ABC transporter substrate-binding protein [Caldilineaceae bacterium]
MQNSLTRILSTTLALLLLVGCATPGPAAAPADDTGAAASITGEGITLRLSTTSEPTTLDPNLAEDYYSITPIEQMFLGLTNINNETEEVEPELAESWEISEDGLTWTFNLRDDAVWSDGKPVTAQDVEYSVKRAIKPETASPYAYVLYIIKNAAPINQTAVPTDTYDIDTLGVTAVDEHTVQFTLEAPASYFLSISSMWTLRPVPSWAIEEYGEAWTEPENIVVNGPYKVTEWRPNESLTFVKNESYFNADDVQIDQVNLSIISDQNTEVALYESGELDIAGEGAASLPVEEVTRIRADATLSAELHEGPRASTTYVGFTMTKAPFDNVLVRKAFSAAIDRETMVRDVVGSGVPATQFAPPGVFGAPDPEVGIGYDPEQAKAWLAEAGYPDGEGFPTVTYRYFSNTLEEALAQALQVMWSETLNVNVELEAQDFPVFLASLNPSNPVEEMPEMWRLGWGADYPDENNFVYEVFHCTDSTNYPRAACTEADDLAKEAAVETDQAARADLYAQVEQMMFGDEVRVAPYYHRGYTILAKPYIQRAYPTFAPVNWDTWRVEQ